MPSRRAHRAVPGEPQLAFDDLLGDAERHNADREWERATAHLPRHHRRACARRSEREAGRDCRPPITARAPRTIFARDAAAGFF